MTDDILMDYTHCMNTAISTRHGLSKSALDRIAKAAPRHHANLTARHRTGELGFYDLPHDRDAIKKAKALAREVSGKYDNFVVLGIGGSALGLRALFTALLHPCHNLRSVKERKGHPRVFVLDNIDPHQVHAVLETLNPKRTLFNVITKSGSTAETASQMLIVRNLLKKTCNKKLADHLVATTDPVNGDLRVVTDRDGLRSLEVPSNVGGRFSILSSVGLFGAAVSGINIDALCEGARLMQARCKSGNLKNPAYLYSAIQYLLDVKKGKSISVMMPYSHRLKDVADWFRQLWAESLGKQRDRDGKVVTTGPTPVNALGVTDQHSQVQLYMEGPNNKSFTFLAVADHGRTVRIPPAHKDLAAFGYLGGKTLNELFEAERIGTELALTGQHRPNLTLHLPKVNAENLGKLFFFFELATAFSGELYNINAFDQPGVEAGKIAAYAQLGRSGYEKEARTIAKQRRAGKRKIVKC